MKAEQFLQDWFVPVYPDSLTRDNPDKIRAALAEVNEDLVVELLAVYNWRHRIVGAWICGLKGWNQFTDQIGMLLLASEVTYAGSGYAFALASFADQKSASYLITYLDYYLRQHDLWYDQYRVLAALKWIDAQQGTNKADRFLIPGGLWETFVADKSEAWKNFEKPRQFFWHQMHYCQEQFLRSDKV